MDVAILVETTLEHGATRRHRIGRLSRPGRMTGPEAFGLALDDGKAILGQLPRAVLPDQIAAIAPASRTCSDGKRVRALPDDRPRGLDTLFGRFRVRVPRRRRCDGAAGAEPAPRGRLPPFSALCQNRARPEMRRLQAELGARHCFRDAARILATVLPCAATHHTTVRNRPGRIARDLEERGHRTCHSNDGDSAAPLTVFVCLSGDMESWTPDAMRNWTPS